MMVNFIICVVVIWALNELQGFANNICAEKERIANNGKKRNANKLIHSITSNYVPTLKNEYVNVVHDKTFMCYDRKYYNATYYQIAGVTVNAKKRTISISLLNSFLHELGHVIQQQNNSIFMKLSKRTFLWGKYNFINKITDIYDNFLFIKTDSIKFLELKIYLSTFIHILCKYLLLPMIWLPLGIPLLINKFFLWLSEGEANIMAIKIILKIKDKYYNNKTEVINAIKGCIMSQLTYTIELMKVGAAILLIYYSN